MLPFAIKASVLAANATACSKASCSEEQMQNKSAESGRERRSPVGERHTISQSVGVRREKWYVFNSLSDMIHAAHMPSHKGICAASFHRMIENNKQPGRIMRSQTDSIFPVVGRHDQPFFFLSTAKRNRPFGLTSHSLASNARLVSRPERRHLYIVLAINAYETVLSMPST